MPRSVNLIFLLLVLLLLPAAVQAQGTEIDSMQIDLWPEYDRPEVLVIYRFRLADSTPLPALISLRIPAASGGPFNVAFNDLDANGESSLFTLDYTAVEEGEWIQITFTAPAADLQLEYYDPNLQRSADRRNFEYTWPADYTVRSLSIQVQQPINASQMQIEPSLGAGQLLQDGLTYYSAMLGEIKAGEQFSVRLSYEKPDETLSESFDPVFPVEPIESTPQTSFNNVLPWLLGGLGLLLVVGVAIWYLIPRRKQEAVSRKRHAPSTGKEEKGSSSVFCHNCGTRSQPGDQFCRACGTKLRR